MYTHLYTYLYAHLYTYLYTCVIVLHICIHMCMHTCIHACIHVCTYAWICTQVCVHMHTCMCACMYMYTQSYSCRYMRGDLLGKLARVIMEAEESHDGLSASWGPWNADSMAQSKSKGLSQWYNSQSKARVPENPVMGQGHWCKNRKGTYIGEGKEKVGVLLKGVCDSGNLEVGWCPGSLSDLGKHWPQGS